MHKMTEALDQRLDQLIRFGLGDPNKLAFYRHALQNPREAVNSAVYRQYVGDALAKLLDVVMSDPNLFNRVRTILQSNGKYRTNEEIMLAAMAIREAAVGDRSRGNKDPKDTPKKTKDKKHPRDPKDPIA